MTPDIKPPLTSQLYIVKSLTPAGRVAIKRNLTAEAVTIEMIHRRALGHQNIRQLKMLANGPKQKQVAL